MASLLLKKSQWNNWHAYSRKYNEKTIRNEFDAAAGFSMAF